MVPLNIVFKRSLGARFLMAVSWCGAITVHIVAVERQFPHLEQQSSTLLQLKSPLLAEEA